MASLEEQIAKLTRERDEARVANDLWQVTHLTLVEKSDRLLREAREGDMANYRRAEAAEASASALRDRVAVLESAIKNFLDGNYQHPRSYRPGKCPHGNWYYEECGSCNDEYFTNALKESTHV